MGRPKKVTDKELLEAIPPHGEISQRDLSRLVNLSESTVSERIGLWKTDGRISVREVREGSTVRHMLSRIESPPHKVEDQVPPSMIEVEAPPPLNHVAPEVNLPASKVKIPYWNFLLLILIIFFIWSSTFLLFPLAEAIGTDFGPITIQEVRNLLGIFLFLGGPLTLLWAWLENRDHRKEGSSKYKLARKKILLVSLLVWGSGGFLSAIPTAIPFGSLISSQVMMIFGFAPLSAVSVSLAFDLIHPKHAKRVLMLLDVVAILGIGCGSTLAVLSITYFPWQVPFLLLGTAGFVLCGLALEFTMSRELSPEQEINNASQQNRSLPQTSNKALSLLFNIALTIALGSLIFYLAQLFIPPYELLVLFSLVVLLALYTSHILYYIYCQNKKGH